MGAVFIECHVANPVKAVFNAPVAAAGIEKLGRVGVFGFETGDPVDGFGGEFVAGEVRRFTADRADLLDVRKIQVSLQFGAGPDLADFQASVGFIGGGVLRGGTLPSRGLRCLVARWAGCL